MLTFRRPSDQEIRAFIARQAGSPFSYPDVGALRSGHSPPGYQLDHNRVWLGEGPATFERAQAAVRAWTMFRLDWVQICWPETPIEPGAVVAVLARYAGLWVLNACRIIDVIDERGPVDYYGIRYGTLADHVERGEEQFRVEWRHDDDSVWYDLQAFSQPNQWYTRLGYRMTRRAQKRFAAESLRAMARAVNGER